MRLFVVSLSVIEWVSVKVVMSFSVLVKVLCVLVCGV